MTPSDLKTFDSSVSVEHLIKLSLDPADKTHQVSVSELWGALEC